MEMSYEELHWPKQTFVQKITQEIIQEYLTGFAQPNRDLEANK